MTKTMHHVQKPASDTTHTDALNVLGTPLRLCSCAPLTGFARDGFCHAHRIDRGRHHLCASITQPFLDFTKAQGNDLQTPRAEFNFPGLNPGDYWCLCTLRWKEALDAGVAPNVKLEATHEKVLQFVSLDTLRQYAA